MSLQSQYIYLMNHSVFWRPTEENSFDTRLPSRLGWEQRFISKCILLISWSNCDNIPYNAHLRTFKTSGVCYIPFAVCSHASHLPSFISSSISWGDPRQVETYQRDTYLQEGSEGRFRALPAWQPDLSIGEDHGADQLECNHTARGTTQGPGLAMKGKSCSMNLPAFPKQMTRLQDDRKAVDVVYQECSLKGML